MKNKFNTITEIIEEIKMGKIVIMLDDDDRENEGDFVMALDKVTPEAVNFMALYGRGLICTPISEEIATRLELRPMVEKNSAAHETAFTVSIDAKEKITTGISSFDRAYSMQLMSKTTTVPTDFVRPGHIFPLIAKDGGVLKRRGHTEAAVDLAKLSGFSAAGVICEILKEDGTMARGNELFEIAKRFNLKIGTIHDLSIFLDKKSNFVDIEKTSTINFPNKYSEYFKLSHFKNASTHEELSVIYLGNEFNANEFELVRFHSECLTGDIFGSLRCDCGEQLDLAMKKIVEKGKGLLFYLRQEGRGIGLLQKLKAYELQEKGYDTVDANLKLGHPVDARNYEFAISVLKSFGIKKVKLLTNNPLKLNAIKDANIEVELEKIETFPNQFNSFYISTKKEKLGHSQIH
jgi:3,4-dihydroxy 2-butanone 4-phosphate synthase/GTP cyclohydrolase II